jgi:hypothetical protein
MRRTKKKMSPRGRYKRKAQVPEEVKHVPATSAVVAIEETPFGFNLFVKANNDQELRLTDLTGVMVQNMTVIWNKRI